MSQAYRIAILAVGMLLLFVVTVAILMRLMPGPYKEIDYLVIGGVATLISLLALFVVLATTVLRTPDLFFRRRKKN